MKQRLLFLLVISLAVTLRMSAQKVQTLNSPNGNIRIEVSVGEQLTYSAFYGSEQILKDCPLSLQVGKEEFGTKPKLSGAKQTKIDETIRPVVPLKYAEVPNKANQLRLTFKGGITVDFRAYDNGISFRHQQRQG